MWWSCPAGATLAYPAWAAEPAHTSEQQGRSTSYDTKFTQGVSSTPLSHAHMIEITIHPATNFRGHEY